MSSRIKTDAVLGMSRDDVRVGMEDFLIGCGFDVYDNVAPICWQSGLDCLSNILHDYKVMTQGCRVHLKQRAGYDLGDYQGVAKCLWCDIQDGNCAVVFKYDVGRNLPSDNLLKYCWFHELVIPHRRGGLGIVSYRR